MTERKGFTLAELVIATLIFSFMIASLATIYATANKHMFQQYRNNTVKSTAAMAMKDIVNSAMAANRIDMPPFGSAADNCPGGPGNCLAVAVNVDQNTGCRISSLAGVPAPAWHYFCLSNRILFHHTGPVTPVPSDCSAVACTNCFTYPASYSTTLSCGVSGGTSITQLSNMVSPGASARLFSRRAADGVFEEDQVKVMLRLWWDPEVEKIVGVKDLTTSDRVIDTMVISNVKINRSVN